MDDQNKEDEAVSANEQEQPKVIVGGTPNPNPAPVEAPQAEETPLEPLPETENLPTSDSSVVSWSGPEFVAYDKNSTWYFYLLIICVILCAVVVVALKDIITALVIAFAFLLIGIYGSRKPKEISYAIDDSGVKIGEKHFLFSDYRNYSLFSEGQFSCISLMPLKRFGVTASLYFPQQNKKAVSEIISSHLPFEQHKPDMVSRLLTRIRF
jgi:hypothetical protein